jgi:hypothetical protein
VDTEVLVVDRLSNGRDFLEQLVEDGFDVKVAFWAKMRDDGSWFLFIGSDSTGPGASGEAYRKVYASLARLEQALGLEPGVVLSDVKLLHTSNPIIQAAIAVRSRGNTWVSPSYFRGGDLGGLEVEEAYVYPPIGEMTPDKIFMIVANLMNRKGRVSPSQVELANGTHLIAVPVGLNIVAGSGEVRVTLFDTATSNRREMNLGEIKSIR